MPPPPQRRPAFPWLMAALAAGALLFPARAAAYVGPGAGFAVLSSFLTLLLAFFYAFVALLTWPLRQLWRMLRGRRAYRKARAERVVIVGFDGMDPELAARWMREGKLPHLARLARIGTFRPLATTHPPISPVAWSTFLTGVNPGKHNIYDFLNRDRQTYLPFLSSAQVLGPRRHLRLGRLRIPLGRPQVKALRKSKPFWEYLGEAGVFSSIIRVPVTFPPEPFSGVLLSGMCVPDLRGSQGTFSLFTTCEEAAGRREGGVILPLVPQGEAFRGDLPGPENPFSKNGGPTELTAPFLVRPGRNWRDLEVEISGKRVRFRRHEYSPWLTVEFRAGWGVNVQGICRMYLKCSDPHVELYVTPVQIDPRKPALPISHPLAYSVYLGKLHGPFSTLGLAEDTWALNEGALTDPAFLDQCYQIHAERERTFFDALEKTRRGLCACVFDITDRVQHMFWRHTEPGHPAAPKDHPPDDGVIEKLYQRMDALVGRVVEQAGPRALVLVISDHGFKSFRRGFNLNAWLHREGYLALVEGNTTSEDWFRQVDWHRTRAYGMGLNGLFLNLAGREQHGVVQPGEADALLNELRAKLAGITDPGTGQVAVRDVFDTREVYAGPYRENAPDLLLGYSPGYRAAWESVSGAVRGEVFLDNTRAWSGDHCIDPRDVPGVLFANRAIEAADPSIADLAPTILDLFGLRIPRHMDGRPWKLQMGPSRAGGTSGPAPPVAAGAAAR